MPADGRKTVYIQGEWLAPRSVRYQFEGTSQVTTCRACWPRAPIALRGMAAAPTIGDGLRPLVALALGGLVPLLVYNDTWTGTAVLVGVVAAYTGIRFGWTVFGPEPRLMTGFFWLFMYIFGGLAPLAQLAAHRWPLGTGVSDAEVQAAATIMLVFVIAWDVGRGYADRAKPPRTPTRAIRPNRITAIVVFAVRRRPTRSTGSGV